MTPAPPVLWQCLADYWALTPAEAKAWWRALTASRWTTATALHRALSYFQPPPPSAAGVDAVREFWMVAITPPRTLKVLDELAREGTLERQTARVVQEKVLHMIDANGHWK
jgi:hypothetical protein